MVRQVTMIAHRGFSAEAPENTLAAFDLALYQGYPHIEFDVQLSRDGEVVIFHDVRIGRTTNGRGKIKHLTLDQLKKLDAGRWFGDRFTGQRIPTLGEILPRYRGIARLHIELKSHEPELAGKVAALLETTGWLQDAMQQEPGAAHHNPMIIISSFNRKQVARSRELLPRLIAHELLVNPHEVRETDIEWAAQMGLRSYNPDVTDVSEHIVSIARERGIEIGAYWCKWQPETIAPLALAGGTHAFVDSPTQAKRVLARRIPIKRALTSILRRTRDNIYRLCRVIDAPKPQRHL
jgi:glycerophosphoryl diester phosphodiesterase